MDESERGTRASPKRDPERQKNSEEWSCYEGNMDEQVALLNICKFILPQFGHRRTEWNLEEAVSGNLEKPVSGNLEESQEAHEDEEEEKQEKEERNDQSKEEKSKSQKNKSMEEKNKGKKQRYYLNDEDLTKILMEEDGEEDLSWEDNWELRCKHNHNWLASQAY